MCDMLPVILWSDIFRRSKNVVLSPHSGKEMIEMYFDFRLYRLWKSRQHSKLLDYDDLL